MCPHGWQLVLQDELENLATQDFRIYGSGNRGFRHSFVEEVSRESTQLQGRESSLPAGLKFRIVHRGDTHEGQ
jgi:hypothetical protein